MNNWLKAFANWFGIEVMHDRVSYSESLSLPPVWYALNKMSGDVGMLPLDVKKRKKDGAINDEMHQGYRLLREQPNLIQAPSVFREQVTAHSIMYGDGRAAIIRDGNSISELIPMLPDRTKTILVDGEKWHITKPMLDDEEDLLESRKSANDAGIIAMRDEDVLHIPGFTFNGVSGIGLLQIAQMTFGVGTGSMRHVRNLIKKGFRGGKLFLEAPAGVFHQEQDAKAFMKAFNETEGGSDNAGKAALLRNGIKANAIAMSNQDAQFVELQKFTRQDVGMLFGLESMPGDGESVSYNSLEQKDLVYLRALDRWLVKWEEQCDMKLRSNSEKVRGSHYFKFNRRAILRTDLQTTSATISTLISCRVLNPNEGRALLDMNPYDGGDTYENPAVSPGTPGNSNDQPSNGTNPGVQPDPATAVLEETLKTLLRREAKDAVNGTNRKDFCAWLDKYYATWETKLADKLESFGLDRGLASEHCNESKEMLLNIAGESTVDTLKKNVEACVASWESRAFRLLGELANA